MLVPSIFSNDLFDNFFNDAYRPSDRLIHAANSRDLMSTDIKEYEDKYELGIELPGYEKKDVTASLKEGYLIVEAERHEDNEIKEKNGKYIRKECFTGKCQRRFYVGEQVTQEDIHAAFDNGILTISVPKIKEQPKVEENHFISIE
ncbi:MAG: Hsp20/alpha crystallin family protein [Lachnospiraceae bacterium]|nr:Hsp20/alpha crystallin family protein [Lachnospiraceae bacterium]